MPFKSKAQRRKFAALLVEGKISPETFEEWNRETGGTRLPERVGAKRGAKRSTTKRRSNHPRASALGRARAAAQPPADGRAAPAPRSS
jgi:hypothetical protein